MDWMGGKDDQWNNVSLKKEEMCWRNGIWHLRVKIASPANTFAIIASVQSSTGCTPRPPPLWSQMTAFTWRLNRRREIRTIVTFLVVLLVRGHDGCGVSWHLACYRMFCACTRAFISDCFAELLCKVCEFLRDCFEFCQFVGFFLFFRIWAKIWND